MVAAEILQMRSDPLLTLQKAACTLSLGNEHIAFQKMGGMLCRKATNRKFHWPF